MSGTGLFGLGEAGMSDWMIDTFIYTGLLIAAVLLLRRPVARHFGPQIAYALWALPLLRFIMPPIVLPAWMAPVRPVGETSEAVTAEPLLIVLSEQPVLAADAAATPAVGLSAGDLLLPLWLAGAAIFLAMRVRDYVRMRRDLLAEARPMGEAGAVRLVETPAVSAPVAFGVRDKVVALPVGFMALLDLKARDMAIAHELEHHRGHDLLANIAAQPLLALHWFNPLAWWGWRAMRTDQEAACDARVVAGRARPERVAYAEVIAGFAAGEHLALAAPMACPVLGEKSIIHRLRSLTMNDVSSSRRRIGIAAITTTALALPLTASISYAQADAPESADSQEAPVEFSEAFEQQAGEVHARTAPHAPSDENAAEDGERVIVRVIDGEDGERRVVRRIVRTDGADHPMSEEEHARVIAELERELADLDRELEGLDGEISREVELAMAEARRAGHEARTTFVVRDGEAHGMRCSGDEPVVERELEDGRHAVMICRDAINASAVEGLREAIDEIRSDSEIPARLREDIIRDLERTIEGMERRGAPSAYRMERKFERGAPASAVAFARAHGTVAAVPARAPATLRVEPASVMFNWTTDVAPELRRLPLVSPLTSVSLLAPADGDCEDRTTQA